MRNGLVKDMPRASVSTDCFQGSYLIHSRFICSKSTCHSYDDNCADCALTIGCLYCSGHKVAYDGMCSGDPW